MIPRSPSSKKRKHTRKSSRVRSKPWMIWTEKLGNESDRSNYNYGNIRCYDTIIIDKMLLSGWSMY